MRMGSGYASRPYPAFARSPSRSLAGVADIDATVAALGARGVRFIHYDGIDQRADGVWTSPSGDLVAWFADPDGNTLSLTEAARR